MLKPFLEQAADPLHIHQQGQGARQGMPNFVGSGFNLGGGGGASKGTTSTAAHSTNLTPQSKQDDKHPHSLEIFKPDVKNDFRSLISYCDDTKLLGINEYNLLVDTKDYLSQSEIKWSISKNHIKLLFNLYLNLLKNHVEHQLTVLKILQIVALNKDLCMHLVNDERFKNQFLIGIKNPQTSPDFKYLSMEMLSNICSHRFMCQILLDKHQDVLFKELGDFVLIEAKTDIETLIHDTSISFFYNLVAGFHLENSVHDENALSLGCALLERMPKFKSNKKTTYRMLALLRSCLVKSANVRELAQSLDFNLSLYKSKEENIFPDKLTADEQEITKNDTYESIVGNIDELIH